MDSAIWLPLIFLFLLRALKSANTAGGALYACFSGLCMGMAILAGSINAPLMDGVVVISAAIYSAFQAADCPAPRVLGRPLLWSGFVALVVAVVSFASASLQLLPSMEYAPLALRWTNAGGALFYQRVPYDVAGQSHRLTPRSLFAFLYGAGDVGGGEFSTYFGVMPLLLTAIGLCRNWASPWVRYLSVLGALCYFWSMGNYSLLHGLLYVLLPFADKACEAGRFIYLTHFAMALLAGFGVQSLLSGDGAAQSFFVKLSRILQWTASVALLALGVPTVLGKPEVSDWPYVSLLFLIATWATFLYIVRGNRNGVARLVLFVVIVCDVYVFNWTALNKTHEEKTGKNHVAELLSARELADFFKRQPGLFRVHLGQGFSKSSIGDVFGIQTTGGWGATSLESYLPALWSPNGLCLFNARYIVEAGTNRQETPIFTSGAWKVYEIPSYCPRAWVVHEVVVDPSSESVLKRIQQAKLDLLRVGYLSEQMEAVLGAGSATPAEISFLRYQANEFELEVNPSSTGLLVLSEIYYPGWVATVNGTTAHIYKVDGMLRGVLVSPGPNRVLMHYEPRFIPLGIALSLTAFLGTLGLAVFVRNRRKRD